MTEIEVARRLDNNTLGLRVLHATDSLDLTDEVTALIEEAAQRLMDTPSARQAAEHRLTDGDTNDSLARQPEPQHRGQPRVQAA